VAAVLLVVLALAAVGVFLIAHRALNQTVPAGSRDGTIVFGRAHTNGDESIFTIRPDGTGEKLLLTSPVCCEASWSHRGDRLLLAALDSSQANLVTTATVNADGSGYTVLPLDSLGLNLAPGAWSPDDSRIAFEGWDDGDASRNGIYTADATGGNRRRVTTSGAVAEHDIPISYSPDGSKILFRRGPQDCGATGDLFVVGVDGGHLSQVNAPPTMVSCNLGGPGQWSPNGEQISFAAFSFIPADPGRSAVFVASMDGTNLKQISDWGTYTTGAQWSPTGDWIAFDRDNNSSPRSHGIFIVHPDGSGLKVIPSVRPGCCAVWSPDGDRLLFRAGPNDQKFDLWTVRVDGSHLTRLTNTPSSLVDVSWSGPTDGQALSRA